MPEIDLEPQPAQDADRDQVSTRSLEAREVPANWFRRQPGRSSRRWPGIIALLAHVVVTLFILTALIGPLLPIADASAISAATLAAPSPAHPMGTDELGRDVFSSIIIGARGAAIVGFGAAAASTLFGTAVGAIAGFFGGVFDNLLMRITEIFQVMPTLILATLIVALYGAGTIQVIVVIAALAWPQTARVVRGSVRALRHREFVDAVRCLGIGRFRILAFEVVPNTLGPVLALGTLLVASAILTQAGLAFLGVSDVGQVSWGRLLNSGQRFIFQAWWLSAFPGLAIMITVIAVTIAGDHLASLFSRREQR